MFEKIKEEGEFRPEESENMPDSSQDIEDTSISYSALRSHIAQFSAGTLFATNRFMKIPRMPLVIFPMVFQFVKKVVGEVDDRIQPVADFFLQNLIYTSLIRAKHHFKIELTNREINNFQKNEKFRRNLRYKPDKLRKVFDYSNVEELGEDYLSLFKQFQTFCESEGLNFLGIFDKFNEMKAIEEKTLAISLNYSYKGLTHFLKCKGPCFERAIGLSGRKLDDSIAFFHYDTNQLYTKEVDQQLVSELECYIWNQGKAPGLFSDLMFYKNEDNIERVCGKLNEIFESPEEKLKRSYKYFSSERTEWNPEDYEKFYEAIKKFNNEQLANKKIAKFMGPHIDPNHVRYERQLYNKRIKLETVDKQSNSVDEA